MNMTHHSSLGEIRWSRQCKNFHWSKFNNIEDRDYKSYLHSGNNLINTAHIGFYFCKHYKRYHSSDSCYFLDKSLVNILYRRLAEVKLHNYHKSWHHMKYNHLILNKIQLRSLSIQYCYMMGTFQDKQDILRMALRGKTQACIECSLWENLSTTYIQENTWSIYY